MTNKSRFYFENGNVDDAVLKIMDIMDNYPSGEYLDQAYQHVKLVYNVENTAERYLTQYRGVISKQKNEKH